jgi:hypothetical protein
VDFLVDRVIEVGNIGDPYKFGTVDFKVEDTPTEEEVKSMTEEELADAYENASGGYGITTVSLFDQDGIQLVMGYYGGTEGIQSVYFDDSYEIEKKTAEELIDNAITLLLSFEIPELRGDFLLHIVD